MSARILVVDDEGDVESLFRQRFRRELREGRFTLDFALSADEALRKIEAGDRPVALLLSDINMPGMNGLDLLQILKTGHPRLPILMITAYGDEQTARTAAARGADGLMSKPLDFHILRAEIETRIGSGPP